MAYPPPVPPVTRTNATPQVTNHPGDHNMISEALTEILNHIAALETKYDAKFPQAYGGATPGGTTPVSGQVTVATMTVGRDGYYIVNYCVLLNSVANINVTLRFFVNAAFVFDYRVNRAVTADSASITLLMSTPIPGSVLGVNVINNGPAPVDCYADGTNHRFNAVQVVYP